MRQYILVALVLVTSLTNAQRLSGAGAQGRSNIGDPQFSQGTYFSQDPGLSYKLGDKGNLLAVTDQGQETQGSRFFLKGWARGIVLFKNNSVHSSSYVLNYDKIGDGLIQKADATRFFEVDMSSIQSFSLIDSAEKEYNFLRLTGSSSNFILEVYKDSLYSLYKRMNTKFYRADYENKGLYEKGYKYDRYEDEIIYYIKDNKGKLTEISNLNKKGFRELLEVFPKAKEFISENRITSDKESYLINLTKYLNKH